jgi:hypothetical protein
MPRTHLAIGTLAVLLAAPACTVANLEGDWEGEIDCGSDGGSLALELEIDESGDYEYEATGEVTKLTLDGVATIIALELVIDQTRVRGGQVLDVSADCTAEPAGGTPYSMDCDGFSEIGWDGEDTMQADVEGFLGYDADGDGSPDLDCLLDLGR